MERLFIGAPAVAHFQMTWVHGEGWNLSVIVRRDGEHWDDAYRATYSHLTTEELVDVIDAEATVRLLRL